MTLHAAIAEKRAELDKRRIEEEHMGEAKINLERSRRRRHQLERARRRGLEDGLGSRPVGYANPGRTAEEREAYRSSRDVGEAVANDLVARTCREIERGLTKRAARS